MRDARAAGDVVEHHGKVGRRRDGPEVGDDAAPASASSSTGSSDEEPVGARLGGLLRHADRVGGVVRAGARDDRDGGADGLLDGVDQVDLLGRVGRGRLPRGAREDEAVAPVVDEEGREALGAVEVDGAVVAHRRDHGGQHGAEGTVHGLSLPVHLPPVATAVRGSGIPRPYGETRPFSLNAS